MRSPDGPTTEIHNPRQLRFVASAAAAAATFLAVSRLIGTPYSGWTIASGTASFGLFGSGGICAKAPELIASAKPRAPAIKVKRRIYSSQLIVLPEFPRRNLGTTQTIAIGRAPRKPQVGCSLRRRGP